MKPNVLMVGLNENIVHSLEKAGTNINLYVIEEEELYQPAQRQFELIHGIRFGGYQQSADCVSVAKDWSKDITIHAVIPGREYSVHATNEVAKALGLPRLGDIATSCMTHKYRLRNKLAGKVLQPRFAKVNSVRDLYEFFTGDPIVLKPSNRQASVGVIKLTEPSQFNEAWNEVTSVTEEKRTVSSRNLTWDYQVEEFIEGIEVSVESFVWRGKPMFHNITRKIASPDRYFVELGHILPANLGHSETRSLLESQDALISETSVDTGMIHSEWIITSNGPYLVECAGRAPGGSIADLFEIAYDVNLYEAYLSILQDTPIDFNFSNSCISCLYHFKPKPGLLSEITGLDRLQQIDGYVKHKLMVNVGNRIRPLVDNWARVGFVILKATDYNHLKELIAAVERVVSFRTEE